MFKNRFLDSVLIMILFVGLSTFPTNLITNDPYIYYAIEIGLMMVMILFIFLFQRRYPDIFPVIRRINYKNIALFTPLLIVPFSNFVYAWCLNESPYPYFNYFDILKVIFICLSVFVEELCFRYILIPHINHENKLVVILISASIFALCHLTHFFASFNPYDLIIVAYSFGLGIVLGFIFVYTNSIVACIIYHLLFNLLNDFLFANIYPVNNPLWYYIINGIIALLAGVYLLLVYLFKLKEKPSRARLN